MKRLKILCQHLTKYMYIYEISFKILHQSLRASESFRMWSKGYDYMESWFNIHGLTIECVLCFYAS